MRMDERKELFRQVLNSDLIQIVLSNTLDSDRASKVRVRPVMIRGDVLFQETLYRGTQVFHGNFSSEEMCARLEEYMEALFRQAQIVCNGMEASVLVGKKGRVTIKRKKREQKPVSYSLSHNRTKQYILPEGEAVDFLVELGVQTPEGHITGRRYDKFRQINRYLEFIEDILDKLPIDRTVRIVDFGCGKSYLTFAMYYYLHQLQHRDIRVTGLDLKRDVIEHCNDLARKLHYDGLSFRQGDIKDFAGEEGVDMVVSLHACDKATDYALEKAVKWKAAVILAVPCCQHELNGQISAEELQPVLKYGVIKERMAALITDALRAQLLEQQGYETQILEFIDMEHTPKNLMIRAVKTDRLRPAGKNISLEKTMEFLHVKPTLKELL